MSKKKASATAQVHPTRTFTVRELKEGAHQSLGGVKETDIWDSEDMLGDDNNREDALCPSLDDLHLTNNVVFASTLGRNRMWYDDLLAQTPTLSQANRGNSHTPMRIDEYKFKAWSPPQASDKSNEPVYFNRAEWQAFVAYVIANPTDVEAQSLAERAWPQRYPISQTIVPGMVVLNINAQDLERLHTYKDPCIHKTRDVEGVHASDMDILVDCVSREFITSNICDDLGNESRILAEMTRFSLSGVPGSPEDGRISRKFFSEQGDTAGGGFGAISPTSNE
ncbi:hypothetical protein NX059_004049 [Plenodomus lindquistii]|nr:hypothetical protein NX059_004049 [Plenodomus lindquistii]